jgi:hypothetical protein
LPTASLPRTSVHTEVHTTSKQKSGGLLYTIYSKREASVQNNRAEGCDIQTSLWKGKVRLEILLPGEDAEIDFGRAFVVGRLIYVSNHGTFTINNSFRHIQPAHCDPGNWVATIAAGFNGEGVLTAILEHDVTRHFFNFWNGTEHLDCTVEIKDIADVTTDRAQHAIERLEDDWDRIAEKMYKDLLNMDCGTGGKAVVLQLSAAVVVGNRTTGFLLPSSSHALASTKL